MKLLHPATIGAAVRVKLGEIGAATRLFGRLVAGVGALLPRPRLITDQIHLLGNL